MPIQPNRTNEALQELGRNLLQTVLESRRFDLQRQQLAQDQKRIDIAEKESNSRAQGQAIDRLLAFAPFLPEGKSIADIPQIHSTFKEAFPEFDPSNPGDLGGIILNKQTMDSVLRPLVLQRFNSLPKDEKDRILDRATNRAILGVGQSSEELAAGSNKAALFNDSLAVISHDPKALESLYRAQVGLEPKIRISYGGKEHVFDTATAANLAVRIMEHKDQMSLAWNQLNKREVMDLSGELMRMMEKNDIILGRPAAMQIINGFDQMQKLQAAGKLTPENNPLNQMLKDPNVSPEMKASIEAFTGAIKVGADGMDSFLEQTPQGRQFKNFSAITAEISKNFPKEAVPGITQSVMDLLSNARDDQGNPVVPKYYAPGRYFGHFGGNTLEFRASPGQESMPQDATAGVPDRAQIASQMDGDARAYAAGKVTAKQLIEKYPDAAQRAAVVKKAQTYRK